MLKENQTAHNQLINFGNHCVITFHPLQHWECKLLFTVFVYTISACAMWIFMEALYLYMLVYNTYFTEKHGVQLYVVFGWCKLTFWKIVQQAPVLNKFLTSFVVIVFIA